MDNDSRGNSTKSKIKLCALMLYPYDRVPGQRYRIEQWEKYLDEFGIEVDYFSFADEKLINTMPQNGQLAAKAVGIGKAFLRRLSHILLVKKYDAVYIYRAAAIVGPALIERIVKLIGKPIIFDFDDAIFLTHTHSANRLFGWAKFARKTDAICRLSDAITVGNVWLGDYARKHNVNVKIIPSSVDTDIYVPKLKKSREKIVIGWTGSSTSQTHLEMFAPLIREIIEKLPIEFHVHSDRKPEFREFPFVWHKWDVETEVEVISSFDIGIMPMPDDEWSLGKCSMKALLYMSLGVPTVCSDIGMNREVIENGETGFLVTTNAEWIMAIEALSKDEKLRFRIGEKSRQKVLENYSMRRCAEMFSQVVKDIVAKE